MQAVCALLLVGCLADRADAAQAAWSGSKVYQSCIAAADGNDPAMADCTQAEFDREDKRLNAAYAARIAASEEPLKQAVRASQRAWLSDRDLTCAAEGAVYAGGTMEPLAALGCKARLTQERADWLATLEP